MKRVAVLTSGGDSPGMNAATRAAVRTGVACGFEMLGVRRGYSGLIAGEFVPLGLRDVGGIIHQGGTVLGTSRCDEFKTAAGQQEALRRLRSRDISALVVIGGNGSQAGAHALAVQGMAVVGIASTIDNDLVGTDVSIGTTTALDTALDAIDRLRVTAASHQRAFLVEVMGRHSGYLALMAAIAGGAEAVVVPEAPTDPEAIALQLRSARARGKSHAIVVVAEGSNLDAEALAAYFREHGERLGFELRVSRLGHIQRGGAPGVYDRLLATRLGAAAIGQLDAGRPGVLIGLHGSEVRGTPLSEIVNRTKPLDMKLLELANILAA
jgi:6-phosphofructokinase 1